MNSPYRKLLLGLRLSSVGLWAVSMSVIILLSMTLLLKSVGDYTPGWMTVALMTQYTSYACLGLGGLGLVVGFVGRCCCLPVPAAAGAAPARIGLAVIFEACSLLSAVALVVVAFLPLPPLRSFVPLTWMGFILLTAYVARVQFLRFARALAEHADQSLLAEVQAVQRLYLYVPCGFLLAYGIAAAGTVVRSSTGDDAFEACGIVLGWLAATAATIVGVIAVWRWAGLLVGLRKAVIRAERQEHESEADPDREYRARYQTTTPPPAGSLESAERA